MKTALRIILWTAALGFAIFAAVLASGLFDSRTDAAGRGLSQALGFLMGGVAISAIAALLLARRWRGWLIVAGVILVLPVVLVAFLSLARNFEDARNDQETSDRQSGRADFGSDPALLAVAEAISGNDEAAIRSAAKAVPNLQAAGRDGKTLLYFAVDQSLERAQLLKAVETLLSLGADPNYTNEHAESYAMARAVHGSVLLLRTMLDAGGNPNSLDDQGKPIIFNNWQMTYFEADQSARFRLLLDHGADINSTYPGSPAYGGYSLAMFRASMGRGDGGGYADALELLERGADPNRVSTDGTTLMGILREHGRTFSGQQEHIPQSYQALCDWLKGHGVEK